MNVNNALFFVFAAILLFAAFKVITSRNSVHSALYLVLSFFNASGIWMLLGAEFLSIALVLVYVGAVMVLFLFVVMMLDINVDELKKGFWKHFPVAAFVGALIIVEMAFVLMRGFATSTPKAPENPLMYSNNTKALGIEMFSGYAYPVQIAAVLLVVAIIAAIALTLRRRKDSKYLNPSEQIKARKADRVKLVKMTAEAGPGVDTSPTQTNAPVTKDQP